MGARDEFPMDRTQSTAVRYTLDPAVWKDMCDRLDLAERVCILYGWSPSRRASNIEDATYQAWREWKAATPANFTDRPQHHELNLKEIDRLALEARL